MASESTSRKARTFRSEKKIIKLTAHHLAPSSSTDHAWKWDVQLCRSNAAWDGRNLRKVSELAVKSVKKRLSSLKLDASAAQQKKKPRKSVGGGTEGHSDGGNAKAAMKHIFS